MILIRRLSAEEREDMRRRRDKMTRERLASRPQAKSFLDTHEQWEREVDDAIFAYEMALDSITGHNPSTRTFGLERITPAQA